MRLGRRLEDDAAAGGNFSSISWHRASLVRAHCAPTREFGRASRTNAPGAHVASDNGLGAERAASGVALLVIDMISCWSFPDAEKLLPGAVAIAPNIAVLKARCERACVPVIYANDNMGRWRSDFASLVAMSLDCGGNVAAVTTALRPSERDYFVLKPKHSAFYATPLALLLRDLQVRRLIVCGVASDQCVMSSVAEARMRDIDVVVPRDCVASQTHQRNDVALQQFAEVFKLKTPLARRLALPS